MGALLATLFATGAASGAAAQASVTPGRGLALAETEKIDPRAGSLSLGITAGRSIAGHQNTVAQASSQAYDYGVIGTTLAAQGCDGGDPTLASDQQPSAVQVDSRQANPTADQDEDKVPVPAHKYASANQTPYGEAVTTTSGQDLGGLIKIGGGISKAHSGLVENGTQREASATVDISGIEIPVAGVSLSSLHWEATWRSTDPQNGVKGVFTIGSATLAGQSLPTNDPSETLTQINGALQTLGFSIVPPQARKNGDMVIVDPMGIRVFQSQTRDALTGGILSAAQPLRQSLFDTLLGASCSFASGITVLDIVAGSLTGAGSFSVILGGVQASSGEAYENSFCLGCGSTPSLGNTTNLGSSGSPLGSGATTTAGGTNIQGGTAPGPTAGTATAAPTKASTLGKRGGALAGVGLAGLALMALTAEGDRRKMRRAQREIPQFEE
jgi:hypothetical protein